MRIRYLLSPPTFGIHSPRLTWPPVCYRPAMDLGAPWAQPLPLAVEVPTCLLVADAALDLFHRPRVVK